jgi:type I site-specific restriction endonuclease
MVILSLFLADRVALVNQAVRAFKTHLPDAAPVNLVTDKAAEGRVFVSTYPTMMGLIDETRSDRQRRFGVGHFDLLVIDEAHRSVFQKYRAIFDYFDSLLVGLTATPKGEVDRNTYSLFDLETGVPTDAYDLADAVADKFLVPARPVSVPVRFQREGISYADLSEAEKEEWDAKDWDEDGGVPDRVEAEAVNKWLFNVDTVDKVLEHLMTNGVMVAGGDRLGKTIVFAKNQKHADFIAERFDKNYPHLKGEFARVITFQTEYAQSLIDAFSQKDKPPHVAVSVDMLDTGIDVPEVVNLVFFKRVYSKTKFWQMVGRGTRLCPDLFGPGRQKTEFKLFDYCGNLGYFGADPPAADGAVGESLRKRLFKARLDLVGALDRRDTRATAGDGGRPEFERFRDKARAFLRRHLDHPAIHKLRTNTRLAAADLSELERMLIESGAGGPDAVERAKAGADGLGVFVRSLVGLDRETAKRAMAGFLAGKPLGANPIEFVNLVVDQLTERGVVDPAVLYEPPFTDVAPRGPDGLFTSQEVDTLVRLLRDIQATAAA